MSKVEALPSSNWISLQKQLKSDKKPFKSGEDRTHDQRRHKRRKIDQEEGPSRLAITSESSSSAISPFVESLKPHAAAQVGLKKGGSIAGLQQLALGHLEYTENQKQTGKYLALDCEMVGVGIDGAESSLARVSLVNFYGFVILDEFVQQKERVVDYRTQWSGIRSSDMVHAKPFEEVQKRVAELLKDRILVGHAVHNDLKALLLSHPRAQTRDTQIYAYKHGVVKSKRPALRNLVKQELDLTIQSGEHSSITDARATMAVYKLHKKEWEKGARPLPGSSKSMLGPAATSPSVSVPAVSSKKRRQIEFGSESDSESNSDPETDDESTPLPKTPPPLSGSLKPKTKGKGKAKASTSFPGGGKKGVSSGLSTVVRRAGEKSLVSGGNVKTGDVGVAASNAKSDWWKRLPGGISMGGGAKASIRMSVKR